MKYKPKPLLLIYKIADICTHIPPTVDTYIIASVLNGAELEGEPGVEERLSDVKHSHPELFLKLLNLHLVEKQNFKPPQLVPSLLHGKLWRR